MRESRWLLTLGNDDAFQRQTQCSRSDLSNMQAPLNHLRASSDVSRSFCCRCFVLGLCVCVCVGGGVCVCVCVCVLLFSFRLLLFNFFVL